MLPKAVFAVIAAWAVVWAFSFLRAAVVTLRTGRPFWLGGHRGGSMPIQASFGRIGAVLITATVIAVAFAFVRMALVVWGF